MFSVHIGYCYRCVRKNKIVVFIISQSYSLQCMIPPIIPPNMQRREPEDKQGCVSSVHHIKK